MSSPSTQKGSPCFGIFSLVLILFGLGFNCVDCAQLPACFCHLAEEALIKLSDDKIKGGNSLFRKH